MQQKNKNLYGLEIEDDGGYNLFRMGRGYRKPDENICYKRMLILWGNAPEHPELMNNF